MDPLVHALSSPAVQVSATWLGLVGLLLGGLVLIWRDEDAEDDGSR